MGNYKNMLNIKKLKNQKNLKDVVGIWKRGNFKLFHHDLDDNKSRMTKFMRSTRPLLLFSVALVLGLSMYDDRKLKY